MYYYIYKVSKIFFPLFPSVLVTSCLKDAMGNEYSLRRKKEPGITMVNHFRISPPGSKHCIGKGGGNYQGRKLAHGGLLTGTVPAAFISVAYTAVSVGTFSVLAREVWQQRLQGLKASSIRSLYKSVEMGLMEW